MVHLVHDIEQALPGLRAEAEGRMVDECTIRRPGGPPVFDEDAEGYVDPEETVVYAGKCEVQISDGLTASTAEAGGTEITTRRLTLKIPVSAPAPRVGDLAEITACRHDASLVGAEFRVDAGHGKTFATARRLHVAEVTSR